MGRMIGNTLLVNFNKEKKIKWMIWEINFFLKRDICHYIIILNKDDIKKCCPNH